MEYLPVILQLLSIVGMPGLLWLGWAALGAFKMRGYRVAYAEALFRAVGAASAAAEAEGLTLFDPRGRVIGIAAGVAYMQRTVGEIAAPALGINTVADHALRVDGQLEAMQVQSRLNAQALIAAATSPS